MGTRLAGPSTSTQQPRRVGQTERQPLEREGVRLASGLPEDEIFKPRRNGDVHVPRQAGGAKGLINLSQRVASRSAEGV